MNGVNKVRGAVYERFHSETELAARLGWSRARLSAFITGKREPKTGDILEMAEAMGMLPGTLADLFLELRFQNRQHLHENES